MDLAAWILAIGAQQGVEAPFSPQEVAQAAFPVGLKEEPGKERWRGQIRSIRAAAIGLARQGKVEILRRGQVVDVRKPIKGLIRIRWIEPPEAG